ncbi:MAG TPA: phosphoglycerate dehydrogenase [Acidimicrobiia bacterium]|nr:phosphoglycerate dehydrogenase [Acidimicrobiia bacterium]
MTHKVVVAEKIAQAGIDRIAGSCEVDVAVDADREELLRRVADADALIVRSATQVDAELIAAAPKLKVVGRAGIGIDNIDLDAATAAGVLVVNAPTANAVSAAEHAMALLLGQARRVAEADRITRGGVWDRKRFQGVELHGKTLGVIGLGRIGTLVAQRALAFGMHLVAFDPYVSDDRARRLGVHLATDLDDLLAVADFITVHLPKTRETEGLIGKDQFDRMKPGVRLVNASRGGIVDEEALIAALQDGRVAGAGLDVFASEPVTESPLFDMDQVVVTPHLGASTQEAQDKAGTDVAASVVESLAGELVTTAVNIDLGRDVPEDILPFLPLAERLGATFVSLAGGLPKRLTVHVEGRLAEFPSRPIALAALRGALQMVSDAPVSYVNAPLLAERHGVRVTEESTPDIDDYASLVRITGVVGGAESVVAGALVGRKGPVLVEALGHEVELPFSEHMLVLLNEDVPGVIGRVGTYLGDIEANIANMVVGRSRITGEAAMMGLNLDRALSDAEIADFRVLEGVARAWYVSTD